MRIHCVAVSFLTLFAAEAPPLPDLKVEAIDGGSVFHIRNGAAQPLTAYLIELVGYPGSSYAMYQEDIGKVALAPGAERRVPIVNMTLGAAPEYVKMQSALYADGSGAGTPEKVSQLIGLRRTTLETTRELVARLEKGKAGNKAALVADLRGWADTIPWPARRERGTPPALMKSTARELIQDRAAELEKGSLDDLLTSLKSYERALASSKPPLLR